LKEVETATENILSRDPEQVASQLLRQRVECPDLEPCYNMLVQTPGITVREARRTT
jgi:hypothetical protein